MAHQLESVLIAIQLAVQLIPQSLPIRLLSVTVTFTKNSSVHVLSWNRRRVVVCIEIYILHIGFSCIPDLILLSSNNPGTQGISTVGKIGYNLAEIEIGQITGSTDPFFEESSFKTGILGCLFAKVTCPPTVLTLGHVGITYIGVTSLQLCTKPWQPPERRKHALSGGFLPQKHRLAA
jgi:hypothetical protein